MNDCKEIAKYITIIFEQKEKNACVKLMELIPSYFTLDEQYEQIARYHWPLLRAYATLRRQKWQQSLWIFFYETMNVIIILLLFMVRAHIKGDIV